MKYSTAAVLLFLCLSTAAQQGSIQQATEKAKQQRISADSLTRSINAATDSMIYRSLEKQRIQDAENMGRRSGEMMLQWHRERQAKERKKMYLYLGMGILFAGVLIVGLLRKNKKKV